MPSLPPRRRPLPAWQLPELARVYAPSLPIHDGGPPDPHAAHSMGAPLYQSLILFGDARKWRAWKAERGEEVLDWRREDLAGFITQLYRNESGKAWQQLTRELQHLLSEGTVLRAYGYRLPRSRDDSPEAIPREVWRTRDIDWGTSALSGAGLSYADVRVIRIYPGASSSREPVKPEQAPSADRRSGRPSLRPEIVAAFRSLVEAGRIDFGKPLRSQIPQIQAEVRRLFGDRVKSNKGMDYEAIRRAIGKEFDASKSSSKSSSKL